MLQTLLEVINSNGVIVGAFATIIGAAITAIVTLIIESKKDKRDTIKGLNEKLNGMESELHECRKTIERYENLEHDEENIDKSVGSIYVESLKNGKKRNICGYCWEKDRVKIPLSVDISFEEYTKNYYYEGICGSCKARCIENLEPIIPGDNESKIKDEDIPF